MYNKRRINMTPIEELNFVQERVFNKLPVGNRNVNMVSRRELCVDLNMHDSNIRKIVKSLLQFGIPVISGPKGGYYIANNNKDIKEYIEFLQIHIDGTEQVKDTMKKIMKNNLFKNVNKEVY